MANLLTIHQIIADIRRQMDNAFTQVYENSKPKYLAVQTRRGTWLVIERSAYGGDEPKLCDYDKQLRACKDQKEAEAFVKLLKEN